MEHLRKIFKTLDYFLLKFVLISKASKKMGGKFEKNYEIFKKIDKFIYLFNLFRHWLGTKSYLLIYEHMYIGHTVGLYLIRPLQGIGLRPPSPPYPIAC